MTRNLYDVGDHCPENTGDWLNEKQDKRARLLPVGLMLAVLVVGAIVATLIAQLMPSSNAASKATSTTTISDPFALCDDEKGAACILSANAYAWRGHRYHLADIIVPAEAGARCPAEADRARKGRVALAVMMNGGAFDARPDAADTDPNARILTRDGVSIGQLMILKGHARPWSLKAVDWCAPDRQ